ncbi:MAG: hypothetical protein Q9165_005437 [Trypethelium subeluteriae]
MTSSKTSGNSKIEYYPNIKANAPNVTASLLEYATHIHTTYPGTSLVFEPHTATSIADTLPFDIYAPLSGSPSVPISNSLLPQKIDLTCTLGGDGTILRAAALFASAPSPPPILSFSMGTIGFLGEWKFAEYKRAFREVYMSGAEAGAGSSVAMEEPSTNDSARRPHDRRFKTPNEDGPGLTGWSSIRGKAMGPARGARVLLRNRLQVGVFARDGSRVSASAADQASPPSPPSTSAADSDIYALNEVLIHRGRDPHLAIVDVFVGGRHLTEAVADGMIVSTPTGSTAYALSSGGSIVHPLVSSLLLTPICPRSLSFRPLVLPANTPVTLRLSEKNRAREVEVSVDGVRRSEGMGVGMEVRVRGEEIRGGRGQWVGGVPSIVRGAGGAESMTGDDHWVGGLNGLLKFNYPFGAEA